MMSLNSAVLDLKQLDLLGRGDSRLHLLDARAKILVTMLFIACVVSFDKYELSALFPFFIFPVIMITLSSLPLLYLVKKIALLMPFVLVVGVFNPFFDREVIFHMGTFGISGGWVSYASILTRSVLTISAAFILIGVTGFNSVCQGLQRLGVPQIFAVQLLFLYRYIFVLIDEGIRVSRARELRACGKNGLGIKSFGTLIGHLLLRTWQRAEHINMAMLARGFSGNIHVRRTSHFGLTEVRFVTGWSVIFIYLRLQNVSDLFGQLVTGALP